MPVHFDNPPVNEVVVATFFDPRWPISGTSTSACFGGTSGTRSQ